MFFEKAGSGGRTSKRHRKDFTRYANLGEMVSDAYWLKMEKWFNGKPVKFKPLHELTVDLDAPIRKGIDAVYENELFTPPPPPPKYIINEVKYHRGAIPPTPSGWKNKLSRTVTKSRGRQMSEKWIVYNIRNSSLPKQKMKNILNEGYGTYLTGVGNNGKKVEVFELSKDLKTIKKLNI